MKLLPILCAALLLNVPAWCQDRITSLQRVLANSKALEKSLNTWEEAGAKVQSEKPTLWTRRELPGGVVVETPAHWILADEAILKQIVAEARIAGNPVADIAQLRSGTIFMDSGTEAMVSIASRPRQLGEIEKLSDADLDAIGDMQSAKLEREMSNAGSKLVSPVKARLIRHELGTTLYLRCESEDEGKRYIIEQHYILAGSLEVLVAAAWPAKNDLAARQISGIQKSLRLKK